MKVMHLDRVKVKESDTHCQVWLSTVIDGKAGVLMMNAKQARKLARKINMAASAVEIRERRNG